MRFFAQKCELVFVAVCPMQVFTPAQRAGALVAPNAYASCFNKFPLLGFELAGIVF